jgi:hypothetical protein
MAAISRVFTIAHVAATAMLGEDEEWLRQISVNMDPEEGCLWVIGVGADGCPAFTEYGIECLKQIIIEERALLARKTRPEHIVPAVLTESLLCFCVPWSSAPLSR